MGFHPSLRREQYRKFCCRGKSTEEKGNGTRELKDVIMRGGRGKHRGSSLKIEQQKNTEAMQSSVERRSGQGERDKLIPLKYASLHCCSVTSI